MVVTVFNKIRTFNSELVDLSPHTAEYAGFENDRNGRVKPFTDATKIISRDRVAGTTDVAARGDVRVSSRDPLTPAEVITVDQILDDHDDTIDSAGQAENTAASADIAALKVSHDAGIADATVALIAKVVLRNADVDV